MNLDASESFTATIEVAKPASEVYRCITREVARWWGGKDYSGASNQTDDVFVVHHPGAHYSKQRVVKAIPDKEVVWHVEESGLNWLRDQGEWTDTKMVFLIIWTGYSSILRFTHEGLVPGKECYAICSEGWKAVIKEWLYAFITEGKPHFIL